MLDGSAYDLMIFHDYLAGLGGKLSHDELNQYQASPQLQNDAFVNAQPYKKEITVRGAISTTYDIARPTPQLRPPQALPVHLNAAPEYKTQADFVVWYGHSTVLLQLDGKKILMDPVFSDAAAPLPWIGTKRYNQGLLTQITQLPPIDVILLSHDHYDHLDYPTIMGLQHKVGTFVVPLGVGCHLEKWGISSQQIKELDWWQNVMLDHINLIATPARHESGRKIGMKNKTLWSSWVIKGKNQSIFFSGDSGYSAAQFQKIGEKYGPFDLTLIECGQYNSRWKDMHMFPEQSLQAHFDLRGKKMLPIHWAAYTLAFHPWKEPIERLLRAARNQPDTHIVTPMLGQIADIDTLDKCSVAWWRQ